MELAVGRRRSGAPEAFLAALGYDVVHAIDRGWRSTSWAAPPCGWSAIPAWMLCSRWRARPPASSTRSRPAGIPRDAFTRRLAGRFVRRFEARTGPPAVLAAADREPPAWAALDRVPELGPSLGRLGDPPAADAEPARRSLDDIRLVLVTGVFELAGAGRSFAAAGDAAGAVGSLSRVAWLGLWEKAVAAAAERIAATANARLRGGRRGIALSAAPAPRAPR